MAGDGRESRAGPSAARPVPAQSAEQSPQHSLSTEGWLLPRGTDGETLRGACRGAYSHCQAPIARLQPPGTRTRSHTAPTPGRRVPPGTLLGGAPSAPGAG